MLNAFRQALHRHDATSAGGHRRRSSTRPARRGRSTTAIKKVPPCGPHHREPVPGALHPHAHELLRACREAPVRRPPAPWAAPPPRCSRASPWRTPSRRSTPWHVDMFVCRAQAPAPPQQLTEHTDAVVINAGDGKHAAPHPGPAGPVHHAPELRPPGRPQGRHRRRRAPQPRRRLAGPACTPWAPRSRSCGPPTFQVREPEDFGVRPDRSTSTPSSRRTSCTCCASSSSAWRARHPLPREYNRLWGLNGERQQDASPRRSSCTPAP